MATVRRARLKEREFAVAGFIGCFLFWALGVVKFDVAFSGFADATAWFLFAAMLIGLVASKSGTDETLIG